MSEVKRVLKVGGLFICSTPNKNITSPFLEKPSNPYHTQEFTLKNFLNLIKTNFKIKGPLHGQILVKRNFLFKLKVAIFTYTPYYKILPFIKKIINYNSKNTLSKNYAKVLSLENLKKGIEPTYIICVAEKTK